MNCVADLGEGLHECIQYFLNLIVSECTGIRNDVVNNVVGADSVADDG